MRLIDRITATFCCLLAAGTLAASLLPGRAHAEVTLRVGVYQNSPKVAVDARGRAEGIFVDILDEIARREDWKVQYVPGTWKEGLDRLARGDIDLMTDVARTPQRAEVYRFHAEPVLASWNEVYARRGSGIRSLPDLAGRRVAVLDNSTQQDYLLNMAKGFGVQFEIVHFPDFSSAFAAVGEGRADAVVSNRFYGMRHAPAAGLEPTAILFDPAELFFAARPGLDPALLAAIDRQLVDLKRSSGSPYYAALQRWGREQEPAQLPGWMRWALPGAALLMALALGWAVTARRQARRLRLSEQRQRQLATELGLILENSLDAICVLDADLRFERASPACEKLWGYTPQELLGRCYLDLVPTADREATRAYADAMRTGAQSGKHAIVDSRSVRKDGSLAPVVWSAAWSSLQSKWYAIARDDTERRRMHRELERHAHALERGARELAAARDAAEAADRTKSAFLATMSHELRTPLNSIIGFTGIVLQELPGPLNAEQKKQLGMVRDSARHLLALINDVLDISKIEAGEIRIVPGEFDLAASVRKTVELLAPLARKKGLELRLEIEPGIGAVTGDARRVEQIVLNLLSNAVKFTEAGGVVVEVRHEAQPDWLRIRVTDTGIGIREEDLGMLFRPFRQVDSELSRSHEGTGLGLAISSRLAQLMGGRVEATSRWGEGSTFSALLPLAPVQEQVTA